MGILTTTWKKIRGVTTGVLLGRSTAGTGRAELLSAAQARTLLSINNVDNTSDVSKPVSVAQAAADSLRVPYTGASSDVNLGSHSLTAGAATFSGTVQQRNGPTPQKYDLFGTYTSSTNFEALRIEATGTDYRIFSVVGSAGGTRQNIHLGCTDPAGTSTIAATVHAVSGTFGIPRGYIINSYQGHYAFGHQAQAGLTSAPVVVGGHLGLAAASSATGAVDTRIVRWAAGQGAILSSTSISDSTTMGDWFCRGLTASAAVSVGVYTFATVPSASANTGKCLRISDRSQKHAYSDGTNWRFFGDDAIIS